MVTTGTKLAVCANAAEANASNKQSAEKNLFASENRRILFIKKTFRFYVRDGCFSGYNQTTGRRKSQARRRPRAADRRLWPRPDLNGARIYNLRNRRVQFGAAV